MTRSTNMTNLRAILRIAAFDLRDLARQPRTWRLLLLLPVVNVSLIALLPGYLTEREQKRQDTATYTVATEGADDDVRAVEQLFAGVRGLRIDEVDDAKRQVTSRRAPVGLVIADGAGESLAEGSTADVRVVTLGTRQSSRVAAARLVAALEAGAVRLAAERVSARGLPLAVAAPVDANVVDLADTGRGARLELGSVLPVLLLLPLSGAIGLAAQRISGTKDLRVFEPLLLLPVSRPVVLAGKSVSGYVVSCVTLPAVALPLVLGRVMPVGGAGRTVSLPLATVAGVVAVGAVLVVLLVALGAFAGAVGRTSNEMASLLPFLTFPLLILGIALQFFDVRAGALLSAVPALGAALLARDVVAGTASGVAAAVTVGSTIVWSVVLGLLGARFLERERSVVRATT